MKLSILIVNWNSVDFLRKSLASVFQHSANLALEVIVIDAGSFDGCSRMLSAEFPQVRFVQGENQGFGRSNNVAFEHAAGDTVLLLNPDTELSPRALHEMLRALEQHPDAGILGPRLLNTDGTLQTTCVRALPTPLNRALDSEFLRRLLPNSHLWGVKDAFRATGPIVVEAVSGACMLLRAEVYRRVGGFRPEYFMYGEDMDLCARVRKLGLQIYYVPGAKVIHHGGGSSENQASQFSTVMLRVAGATYMRLNHGAGTELWYRLLQAVSALIRLLVLLPASVLLVGPRRISARMSLQKWSYVLQWAVGRSAIGLPSDLPQAHPVATQSVP